jgi:hypothetical protein
MSKKTSTIRVQGIGTLGLLGVLFVGLKLTGHVDWSWFWVTMPFWGGAAVVVAIIVVLAVVGGLAMGVAGVIDGIRDVRKQRKDRIR